MPASMARRCEIDLSPGNLTSPRILPLPLIPIVLDIASSALLHNDAPCDYPAQTFMRDPLQASGLERRPTREPMSETIERAIHGKLEFVDLCATVTTNVTTEMDFSHDDARSTHLDVRV